MNMNSSTHRTTQASVGDPEWYTRNSTRLKPGSPTTETTVIDDLVSLGASLTSFNLDSINIDFDSVGNNHYSNLSLPAILMSDAPWNESPRSFRSQTPTTARRVAAMSIPPPGISPLDHLQNSISNLSHSQGIWGGPPVSQVITEEEEQDVTDLHESFGSLQIETFVPPTVADMDATAHAGNITRSTRSTLSVSRPSVTVRGLGSSTTTGSVRSWTGNYGRSSSIFNPNPTINDEDDNDEIEIIKLLRRQVETLKSQLVKEQNKNLQATAVVSNSNHNMQASGHHSTASSSYCKTNDDDDDSGFALPTGSTTCSTDHTESSSTSNATQSRITKPFHETMQSIHSTAKALERPQLSENDRTLLLEDLQTHVIKLDLDYDKFIESYTQIKRDRSKLAKQVEQQGKTIQELERLLKASGQQ